MGNLRLAALLAPLLALVLGIAGCVKVDQTLTIEPNGSGTFDIRYGMSEQTIAQLEAMDQMAKSMGDSVEVEQQGPLDFDEATLREKFAAEKGKGVELVSVASEVVEGWKFMTVKLRFDDLAALKRTEFFEDSGLSLTRNDKGDYVLSQRTDSGGAGAPNTTGEDEEAMGAAMMEQMATMFAGLRVATSVVVPGDIIETNGEVEGRKASWVFDLDADPTVLSKLDKTDLTVTFSGKGLNLTPVAE